MNRSIDADRGDYLTGNEATINVNQIIRGN